MRFLRRTTDPAEQPPPAAPRRAWAARWLPLLIWIGGLTATVGSTALLLRSADARNRLTFLHATDIELRTIRDQFATYAALLRGAAGLFAAQSDQVTLAEFRAYVRRIEFEPLYPGILGLGFTATLPASERAGFEARAETLGVPGLRVRPDTANPTISPVLFAEPQNPRNQAAIGYDVMSDPLRREMVERARDTGQPAASARIQLVQEIDQNKQAGFLVAVPVYAGGAVPSTVDERRRLFLGFIFGAFRADDLFRNTVAPEAEDAAFAVYDGEPSGATLLHRSAPDVGTPGARHTRREVVEVGGRAWTVLFTSRASAHRSSAPLEAWFAGGGGLLATALLSLATLRQRRTQEEVHRLNASLEARVEERTRDLLLANDQLRQVGEERARMEDALRQAQKMEAVGQLTGGVAHDFNNLLTVIRASTDLLRRPDLAEARRRRYVDAISDTVDRASKLTQQLLAFARRQALQPEVFDAAARIRAVTDMLRTLVGARIAITAEIACQPCWVRADASQFETALVNMSVNARDAMAGEGTLTIALAEVAVMPPIRGHGGGPGPFMAVSLTDTGSGIAPDKLTQIFEPFFTTKPVGQGTGLGLSQVFGFAKQSGGDVDVASTPGQGTTFTLYLPRAEAPAAAEMGAARAEAAEHGRGRRVLVVEDNVEVGRFSTQVLEDLGYRTVWATNAEEALARLGADTFDVVFTDVVMPGVSGVDLAKEVRRRHPDLPVVLTSGYSHVLAQEGTHGLPLVRKPYAAEELSRVLRHATAQSRRPPSGA